MTVRLYQHLSRFNGTTQRDSCNTSADLRRPCFGKHGQQQRRYSEADEMHTAVPQINLMPDDGVPGMGLGAQCHFGSGWQKGADDDERDPQDC
ncbi:MAG: hypothetical protein JOZ80_12495 [Acidobacteriaceae bacterium]|nr:hypothetical protein [Acidobacteriaceae bacterium]